MQPKTLEYFRSGLKTYWARSSSLIYIHTANHILSLRTWWKRKFVEQKSRVQSLTAPSRDTVTAPARAGGGGKNEVLLGGRDRFQVATSRATPPSGRIARMWEKARNAFFFDTSIDRNAFFDTWNPSPAGNNVKTARWTPGKGIDLQTV